MRELLCIVKQNVVTMVGAGVRMRKTVVKAIAHLNDESLKTLEI